MALDTYEQLLQGVDKALQAGNVDMARELALAAKQERARMEPLPHYKIGQEGMPDAIKAVAAGAPVRDQRLAGLGTVPMIAGHAVAQLAGANNQADIQNQQALRNATPDTSGGNLVGNALMMGALPTRSIGPASAVLGAKELPRWANVADMAATQGGIAGATTPGDVSDRVTAGALGVSGASVPGVFAAGQTARRATTLRGRQLDLAENLRRELDADTPALIKTLEGNHYPTSSFGVQPSAAMLTKNPTLQVMETGSRVRTPDQWANFDRANATARWQELERQAGSPQELQRLKELRDTLTTPQRDTALGASPGTFYPEGRVLEPLAQRLEALSTGANRPNKDVQTLVAYVKGELEQGATPEQLYTIRKMLTDGIKAGPTSELSQAARAARPQRMEIIQEIDNALNGMSGGKWQKYLDAYKGASPDISSMQAMQNIRERLTYGRPAGEIPASMGEKPSPYALGRLLEQYGTKKFGSKDIDILSPRNRQLVEALMLDLENQTKSMLPRATLGSPTAPFLANAGRVNQITNGAIDAAGSAIPLVGGSIAASAKGSLGRRTEEALATLLKDPVALAEALRRAEAASRNLNLSGRAGAASGAAARAARD